MEKKRVVDYPEDGIELGQGWDSETGNKKSAIGVVFVDPEQDLGQKKFMSFEKVSDRHNLMQALEISAEVQYKGLCFSTKAKSKFAKDVETSSIFESFVARARVDNALKYAAPAPEEYAKEIASLIDKKKPLEDVKTSLNLDMRQYREKFNLKATAPGTRSIAPKGTRSVRLTPSALEKAKASLYEFHRVYGDCFVSGITLGAELCAVMTFEEFNKKKREEIETSIEGSGWGFHAKGEFTNKVIEYSQQKNLKVKYYEAGGEADEIPTEVQGFLAKIKELPELAAENPIPFKITLQSYDSLPNWPKDSELDSTTPYKALQKELLRRYFEYKTLHDDIYTILANQAEYLLGRGVDEKSLKDMQDELLAGCNDICHVLKTRGQIDATYEMPESAQKSDYDFRIRMPIPCDYDENISIDMAEYDLRELISEFWIENKSKRYCKRRLDDPGCLNNKEIDEYKLRIPSRPFLLPEHLQSSYYHIINKVSGYGLLPQYSGERSNERGMHHWPMGQSGQNQDGFLWKIEQVDDKHYKIINKVSGYGLLPAYSGERLNERGMHHWPMGQSGQNQDGFLWQIIHVRGGYYQIVNKKSGYGLLPQYSGQKRNARGVHHWPMGQSGQNQDGFLWKIKWAGRIK